MSRRNDILAKIHPRYLPVIAAALAKKEVPAFAVPIQDGKRIRQSREKLNALETKFLIKLLELFPGEEILAQQLRLRIGNGIWYKPDFVLPVLRIAWEVKGPHAFRGGMENLKMAAGEHRWLKFFLVWKRESEWVKQEVLP